jgi:sphingolipid delta-4 desaturase
MAFKKMGAVVLPKRLLQAGGKRAPLIRANKSLHFTEVAGIAACTYHSTVFNVRSVAFKPPRRAITVTLDFKYDQAHNAHIFRAREIRKKYPEVRTLMGVNQTTAVWSVTLVATQLSVAYLLTHVHWLWLIVAAYAFGAFVNHALYVIMHECTHNLVFRNNNYNRILGIFGDLALAIPSAMAFRKYHLLHHQYLGQYDMDPDIVSKKEGRLVGNSTIKKFIWISLLSLSQALRPLKIKNVEMLDRWIISNIVIVLLFNALLIIYVGPQAFIYLLISTFFALGAHPVGGRWIQEHYDDGHGQETHSYYGPLNKVCFNMGYHNEHHDFASIPWNKLPELKRLAPEFYDELHSYRSWTSVLRNFIFDRSMSPFSRVVHVPAQRSASKLGNASQRLETTSSTEREHVG